MYSRPSPQKNRRALSRGGCTQAIKWQNVINVNVINLNFVSWPSFSWILFLNLFFPKSSFHSNFVLVILSFSDPKPIFPLKRSRSQLLHVSLPLHAQSRFYVNSLCCSIITVASRRLVKTYSIVTNNENSSRLIRLCIRKQ